MYGKMDLKQEADMAPWDFPAPFTVTGVLGCSVSYANIAASLVLAI